MTSVSSIYNVFSRGSVNNLWHSWLIPCSHSKQRVSLDESRCHPWPRTHVDILPSGHSSVQQGQGPQPLKQAPHVRFWYENHPQHCLGEHPSLSSIILSHNMVEGYINSRSCRLYDSSVSYEAIEVFDRNAITLKICRQACYRQCPLPHTLNSWNLSYFSFSVIFHRTRIGPGRGRGWGLPECAHIQSGRTPVALPQGNMSKSFQFRKPGTAAGVCKRGVSIGR